MATKKNVTMEPENNALAPSEMVEKESITPENSAAQDSSDDMDLNELLESMDSDSEQESLDVPEDAETFPEELFEDLDTDRGSNINKLLCFDFFLGSKRGKVISKIPSSS